MYLIAWMPNDSKDSEEYPKYSIPVSYTIASEFVRKNREKHPGCTLWVVNVKNVVR